MNKVNEDKICFGHATDDNTLNEIKNSIHGEKVIQALSSTFKALGDPTRLKIIYALSKSSLCVCDIATLLDMTQSAISHHLRLLRDIKLVRFKKEGKLVIYSLDDEHVFELFEQGLVHARHQNDY